MDSQQLSGEPRDVHPDLTCPMCNAVKITTSWEDYTFTYGSGESAVELTAHIPIRQCTTCKFDYLDHEAEQLKHEALCKHFGVLTPVEIRHIRNTYRMARARFAEATGLGEASLNRWENGTNIQTHANDRYLRLLAVPQNMQHLERLMSSKSAVKFVSFVAGAKKFQALDPDDESLLKEKESFQLRKVA